MFEFKYDNGYGFVTVSEEFAELAEEIMSHEGFRLRYTIKKKKYPGKKNLCI